MLDILLMIFFVTCFCMGLVFIYKFVVWLIKLIIRFIKWLFSYSGGEDAGYENNFM